MQKLDRVGAVYTEIDARNDIGPNVVPVPRLACAVREAAALLRVHHNTIYALLRSGQLRHSRVGRRYVISVASMEASLGVGR